ncbi:MAG: type II secretion system F family protein [Planctomycetota bacterium]
MNSVLTGILLATIALVVLLHSSMRRRTQRELRSRVFEIIAAAVRRSVPIAPAILRMAESERGALRVALTDLGRRLDGGESVGSALASSMPGGTIPRDVLAAIRSTEGTAAQRLTLEALAGTEDRVQSSQDQLSMALAYPALLAVSLVGVQATTGSLFETFRNSGPGFQAGVTSIAGHLVALGLWTLLGFALVGNVATVRSRAHRLFSGFAQRLPYVGKMVYTAASARVLRASAALAGAGMPLGELLRRSARATGLSDLRKTVADAGDMANTGAMPEEVWHRTNLPDYAVAMAELSIAADPPEMARRLRLAATACDRRVERMTHRLLGIIQPTVIVVIGALIASQFAMVFERLLTIQTEVEAW